MQAAATREPGRTTPASNTARPGPQPGPRLVPDLGAGGSAGERRRARMEHRGGGEAGPLPSLWLPLGRRRLYLTAAVPERTRHMG